jgi:hypothetical protein
LVIIGSDLQEPVDLYIDFFKRLEAGDCDVLLGERLSRDDPFSMRFFSAIYWWINRKFINSETPKGGFDGVGLSAKASKTLIEMPELNTSFTSQLQWIGYKQIFVPFHRMRRQSGKSSWTYKRKVKLFADSVYGFTGAPIAFLTIFGIVITMLMLLSNGVDGSTRVCNHCYLERTWSFSNNHGVRHSWRVHTPFF